MRIVLVRHAQAVDAETLDDAHRWLAADGRVLARRLGARLREEGVAFGLMLTSPLVRAVQTGELLAQGMGWNGAIEILHWLSPGASTRAAVEDLVGRGEAVCAVGHEPGISALAGALIGRPVGAFKKGQAMVIDHGAVSLIVDPDALFR